MFAATVSAAEGTITMTLAGTAEAEAVEELRVALERMHAQALGSATRRVVLDLRDLEFATSSALKELASWLIEVGDLPAGYTVTLQSASRHHWQRRSLHAMAGCAPHVVTIENQS